MVTVGGHQNVPAAHVSGPFFASKVPLPRLRTTAATEHTDQPPLARLANGITVTKGGQVVRERAQHSAVLYFLGNVCVNELGVVYMATLCL